jgi:2-(3-amino-3-carboxypropyl)histidine synthase
MEPTEGVEVPSPGIKSAKPRKRFVGTSAKASSSKTPIRRVANQIPDDILHDPELNGAIASKLSPKHFM